MEQVLKDFGINPLLLAAQVVNFLILLWILSKFLYRPILKVLTERRKKIEDSLKNAAEIELRLQEAKDEADRIIAKASLEGQKILDESTTMGMHLKDEIMQKATKSAETMLKKNEEALILEKEKMMNEVRAEAADLVVLVLHKITGQVITREDQKKMIEQKLKGLS